MQWPDYFPDGCPPQDAQPAAGEVYRLVKKDPPEQEDFKSLREKKPRDDFGEQACQACGLSVFQDDQDVLRVKRRAPGMQKRLVARGTLTPDFGQIKQTSSKDDGASHHTWWVPTKVQPLKVFHVVQIP